MIENSSSKMHVAGCFVEKNNETLLLHIHKDKPQGLSWGIPSGKIEQKELVISGLQREEFEETKLSIMILNGFSRERHWGKKI